MTYCNVSTIILVKDGKFWKWGLTRLDYPPRIDPPLGESTMEVQCFRYLVFRVSGLTFSSLVGHNY